MSAKDKNQRLIRRAWLPLMAVVAIVLLAYFPVQAQQEREREEAARRAQSPMTPMEPTFDIRKAIPGVTEAHTSAGKEAKIGGSAMGHLGTPREVILDALPKITRAEAKPLEGYENDRPMTGLDEEQYMELKRIAAQRASLGLIGSAPSTQFNGVKMTPKAAGSTKGPLSASLGGFYGQGEIAACGGCVPSDMALAVGTNFVVQMVNSAIAVYDKNGNLQSGYPKSADTFFGLSSGTYTTDPRLIYDWTYHRWIAVMLTETSPTSGTNTGSLLIAASQGQDPRLGWWVYSPFQVGAAGECPDYPTLGQDSNNWGPGATKGGFYIGINHFTGSGHCSGATFSTPYFFMFPKDAFYSGAGFGYWYFYNLSVGGTLIDTLQAFNTTDRADRPSAILAVNSLNIKWGGGVCSSGCNGLDVWAFAGPTTAPFNPFAFLDGSSGGPQFSEITVTTVHNYSLPPLASEPGCLAGSGPCVDTNDTRISGAVKYHAGSLFGSMNTGVAVSPAVAGPIWFEIKPELSNSTGLIVNATEPQEDCFLCGSWANNGSAWFATLQPDPENNLMMGYEYSTDTVYPSTVITSRRVTYHPTYMNGGGLFLVQGTANYFSGRWGDYTATSPDLTIANDPVMWFAGMYADSSGNWGTAVGHGDYVIPADQ